MSDTATGDYQSTPTPNGQAGGRVRAGMMLPKFRKGSGRPSTSSASDMNLMVDVLNAFLNLKVVVADAEKDPSGQFIFGADFKISNSNSILTLKVPPDLKNGGSGGPANVVPMQVQGYTATDEYFSAKLGSFTAADTFTATGSAINVALPWLFRPAQNPGTGFSLFPAITAGDIILAIETDSGENGVYVSGAELEYMDLGSGRYWKSTAPTYRGTYSATTTYHPGDIVRVLSGTSQGTWIRVSNATYPGATTGTAPVWPEPVATGGVNAWDNWVLGAIATSVCSGGAKTVYSNATPPI